MLQKTNKFEINLPLNDIVHNTENQWFTAKIKVDEILNKTLEDDVSTPNNKKPYKEA